MLRLHSPLLLSRSLRQHHVTLLLLKELLLKNVDRRLLGLQSVCKDTVFGMLRSLKRAGRG